MAPKFNLLGNQTRNLSSWPIWAAFIRTALAKVNSVTSFPSQSIFLLIIPLIHLLLDEHMHSLYNQCLLDYWQSVKISSNGCISGNQANLITLLSHLISYRAIEWTLGASRLTRWILIDQYMCNDDWSVLNQVHALSQVTYTPRVCVASTNHRLCHGYSLWSIYFLAFCR